MAKRSKRSKRNYFRSRRVRMSRRVVFGRKYVDLDIYERGGTEKTLTFYQSGTKWIRKVERDEQEYSCARRRFQLHTQHWADKHPRSMHKDFRGMRFETPVYGVTVERVYRFEYTGEEFEAFLASLGKKL